MAGFGGSVKLKGESEYRRALNQITQSLKVVSSEMKAAASSFESGDKSQEDLASSSEELKAALEKEKAALSTLKGQLSTMQAEYNQTGAKHQKLVDQYNKEKAKLEEIKATYGETSNEYKDQQRVVDELAQAVSKSQKAYDAQGRALNNMKIRTANAETTVNNTAAALDRLGDEAQNAGNEVEEASGGFTVMKGALANLAGNLISTVIDGIKNLAGEAISSSDSLKKFESTMQFAGYNGSQIKKAKDDMKEYADKTVYDLQTISNTTAQLAANGVPNYEKLTEAAGNLNAVAGGNSETFQSVAMVLTQTAGAGKLTTENWNQLSDAIPGASGKIQEALKKNGAYTGNFRDAMEDGQITADEFNKAIMDLGFTDSAEQAAKSTDTFEGAVGNLQAAVVDGLMKIYDAIGPENVTGFINTLSNIISAVIPPIKTAVGWFVDNLPKIAPLLVAIGAGLGVILVAQKVEAMVSAFQAWRTATEGMTIAQAALNAIQLANPIGLIIAGVVALVAAIVYLWNTNEGFRSAVINIWNGIKDVVVTVATAIKDFVTTVWDAIKSVTTTVWEGIKAGISTVWGGIQAAVSTAINAISMVVMTVFNAIGAFIMTVWNGIQVVTSTVWNAITAVVTAYINATAAVISAVFNGIRAFITTVWNGIQVVTSTVWNAIKTAVTTPINAAKTVVTSAINGIKATVTSVWNAIRSVTSSVWNAIKSAITNPIESARNTVSNIVGRIKDTVKNIFRGIKPKLDISLPHISVKGGEAPFGIGGKGRLPSFDVRWYAKGGVFDEGAMLAGIGEDGAEAVVPLEHNTKWIRRVADEMRSNLTSDNLSAQETNTPDYGKMVEAFKEALSEMKVEMDDREMGKFVDRTVTQLVYN